MQTPMGGDIVIGMRLVRTIRVCPWMFAMGVFVLPAAVRAQGYDPLAVPKTADAFEIKDVEFKDKSRDREIPLRIFLPAGPAKPTTPSPVIVFSHGLGGTRRVCGYLGEHWAARGYAVVMIQHVGSDDSAWRNEPATKRLAALKGAASAANWMLRVKDIPATLDQLTAWNGQDGHFLKGRLDLEHVGMSGHSFGAVTTQAVSGQFVPATNGRFTEKRIDAAMALSPSTPKAGNPARAFGSVAIPWMLMTGTKDVAAIGDADVESRLAVFPNLPPKDKYEVVLENGEHHAFTDGKSAGERMLKRNPNHHRVILGLSTAFWDAYLRQDAAAKAWLQSEAPRALMEKGDRWQIK